MVMAAVAVSVTAAVAAEDDKDEDEDNNKEGRRQQGWTDNDKDFCNDEVMMVRRRRTPIGMYEAGDKENYCCHDDDADADDAEEEEK